MLDNAATGNKGLLFPQLSRSFMSEEVRCLTDDWVGVLAIAVGRRGVMTLPNDELEDIGDTIFMPLKAPLDVILLVLPCMHTVDDIVFMLPNEPPVEDCAIWFILSDRFCDGRRLSKAGKFVVTCCCILGCCC